MSIDALLQAAEYLDRREREAEHGYASTLPMPDDLKTVTKRPKTKKSHGIRGNTVTTSVTPPAPINIPNNNNNSSSNNNMTFRRSMSPGDRTTHNELEKNRRAHLRNCLEKLKEIVPLGHDSSRHTTLGLLTKAKSFIKTLERQERKSASHKDQLRREQRYLGRRLEQLGGSYAGTLASHAAQSQSMSKRRSVSECSNSTVSSSSSAASSPSVSSISESDEVDVIGYTSTQSDTDDHSSVQSVRSASSDSGVAMSTSRLTLAEMELV